MDINEMSKQEVIDKIAEMNLLLETETDGDVIFNIEEYLYNLDFALTHNFPHLI